jgi:hypothetical protein
MLRLLLFIFIFFRLGFVNSQIIGFHFEKEKKNKMKISFKKANNLIVIPCFINDYKDTLNFVLDTGVGNMIITDPELPKKLTLHCQRNILINATGSLQSLKACIGNLKEVRILPDIIGKQISVVFLEKDILHLSEYAGMKIHGIIGYELFSRFVVHINYRRDIVIFQNPSKFRRPRKKYIEYPLLLDGNKPYLLADIWLEKDSIMNAKLLLDTGAGHSLLLEKDSDKKIQLPKKTLKTQLGVSLVGAIQGHIGRIEKIKMKDFELKKIITNFPDTSSIQLFKGLSKRNGTIGVGLIKKFHWVIDYSRQRAFIKKNISFKNPFEFSTSGIELIALSPTYKIFAIGAIRPNCFAEKAGLQINDKIIFLDGEKIEGKTMQETYNLLNKKKGKKTILIVQRGESLLATTIVAEELL